MKNLILAAAAAALLMLPEAAAAQQSSMKDGPLWSAGRIYVEDGQRENYLDFLANTWSRNQEFAKSQGWILEYNILESVNPRDGEPNIILITRFADMPTAAEAERRTQLIQQRMNQDDRSAEAASGARTKMRRQMGSVLYRELVRR